MGYAAANLVLDLVAAGATVTSQAIPVSSASSISVLHKGTVSPGDSWKMQLLVGATDVLADALVIDEDAISESFEDHLRHVGLAKFAWVRAVRTSGTITGTAYLLVN